MACIINRPNGHRWVQWLASGRRHRLRLGQVNRAQAESVVRLVEEILAATRVGERIDNATHTRVLKLSPALRQQMAKCGLIRDGRNPPLGEFLDDFIHASSGAPNTLRNHRQLVAQLKTFFGPTVCVRDIRPSDADRWRKSRQNQAASTLHREIKRAKQFFAAAVRDGLIAENPFGHLRAGKMSNSTRCRFIDRRTTDQVLAACPNQQWRVIFALARFGALRVPSDLLAVRWADVDWKGGRFAFYSRKDKRTRTVPLFPELRAELQAAYDPLNAGEFVVTACRNTGNLRAGLERILRKAQIPPWPRLWHNLRATRITELCDRFPQHVVSEWVGNTEQVAKEHYLLLTEDHFAAAIKSDKP